MALHNPPNLYSAGAVKFDTRPDVNIFIHQLRQRQAREEAMDEYERNRINRINEAGLRDQDREGLDKMVLDLKGYYGANKEAIRKGNSAAAYEYEKKIRDTLGYISKSKDATAKAETFNKIRLERQKMGRATPEDWFQDYMTSEQPISSEQYKPLDLTKYMQQAGVKYDPQKTLKMFADIKRTPQTPRYENIPEDRFSRREFIDETFDPQAKTTIAARAHELYDTDDGFAAEVQESFNNPVKRGELEKISIEQFGSAPQSMGDYAAAKVIQQLQPTITGKPKTVPNWQARKDYENMLIRGRIALNKSLGNYWGTNQPKTPLDLTQYNTAPDGTKEVTNLVAGYDIVADPKSKRLLSSSVVYYNPTTGNFVFYDPLKKESIAKDYKTMMQDIFALNPQKDVTQLYRLPIGNSTIGDELKKQIPAVPPPERERLPQPKQTISSYLIKGKKYTEKELLKMGYTLDQIKPYKQ